MMTEVTTSALNLFFIPAFKTSIVKGSWVEVCPTNSLDDDSAIDFEISSGGTDYLDLADRFTKVKVRVTSPNNDGGYVGNNLVAPVNNLLHCLFNKVDVMLNKKTCVLSIIIMRTGRTLKYF